MTCRQFRKLVVLAREAELSREQRAGRNEHEAECLGCRQFCRDMRGIEYLLGTSAGMRAPEDFAGAVIRRIRESRTPSRRGWALPVWRR